MHMLRNAIAIPRNFEKEGGKGEGGEEGDQKWFLELPRATPGSLK